MSKVETLRLELAPMLVDPERVTSYLTKNSGLPGKRANLELAAAFADLARKGIEAEWHVRLRGWAALSAAEAPTNDPREFLPFVAVQAFGAMCEPGLDQNAIESVIRGAANDPRWRMREAAAFALQRIGERDRASLTRIADAWLQAPSLLDMRAVLTALAHPPLLASADVARHAIDVADNIMDRVLALSAESLRSDQAKALLKCLGFAPSVFVAALPDEGFALLERWADRGSLIAAKAVAANLRKARLARSYPDRVEDIGLRLAAGDYAESE